MWRTEVGEYLSTAVRFLGNSQQLLLMVCGGSSSEDERYAFPTSIPLALVQLQRWGLARSSPNVSKHSIPNITSGQRMACGARASTGRYRGIYLTSCGAAPSKSPRIS